MNVDPLSGYSGGTYTVNGLSRPYATSSEGWGGTTANGTCSGQITVTFRWQGTGAAPSSVIVDETCVAESRTEHQGDYYTPGSVDNGLGDDAVPNKHNDGTTYVSEVWKGVNADLTVKHHYTVIQAPGASFTRTINPSATWTTPSPPVPSLLGSAKLHYTATLLPNVDVRKIEFSNSHGVLINHSTNFGDEDGSAFSVKGWQWPAGTGTSATSYPVSISRLINPFGSESDDANILVPQIAMTYDWEPARQPYFVGYYSSDPQGSANYSFPGPGQTSTGDNLMLSLTAYMSAGSKADQVLPIGSYKYGGKWRAYASDGNSPSFDTTEMIAPLADFFVTWGAPITSTGNLPTTKRMNWVCDAVGHAATKQLSTDRICAACTAAPYSKTAVRGDLADTWKMLDGLESGDCLMLANLMLNAMRMVGLDGETLKMRASTNANVTDIEEQDWSDLRPAYLIMWFNSGLFTNPYNAFEGVCHAVFERTAGSPPTVTSDRWYTVNPNASADTLLHLFNNITFTQVWVHTWDNMPPDDISNVMEVTLRVERKPIFP